VLHNRSNPVKGPRLTYHVGKDHTRISCPPCTAAFLYYFSSPKRPPIAGELRFRVASSDDPTSFESGSDLLRLNGQPWSRPLLVIQRYCFPLYVKLREEQLVPDDLDAVLSTFSPSVLRPRSQLLYTLNDELIVNFGACALTFSAITEQGMATIRLDGLFTEELHCTVTRPYTGAYTNHHLSILLD
jgi:hypothetical protein